MFLDRDGVINRAIVRDGKPYPPDRLEDLEVLPGVGDALARLKAAGFALVVVTNQPDVARGRQTADRRERDARTAGRRSCRLMSFACAGTTTTTRCECRKPKPGLITRPPPTTCAAASSSAIAGAMSKPAAEPAAGRQSSWITAMMKGHR